MGFQSVELSISTLALGSGLMADWNELAEVNNLLNILETFYVTDGGYQPDSDHRPHHFGNVLLGGADSRRLLLPAPAAEAFT